MLFHVQMNTAFVVASIFALLALLAIVFAVLPVWRTRSLQPGARIVLMIVSVAVVIGIGGGLYTLSGTPTLAMRSLSAPAPNDVPALIAALAAQARTKHFDSKVWALLGRGYLSLGDPMDAAAAFRRALQAAPASDQGELASAYGEALTAAASGTVTAEAEQAFDSAIVANPRDPAAHYYLGLAEAARGHRALALMYWQGLLRDTPPGAPWRAQLLDHIAALSSQSGSPMPNISAMVAGLAKRLDANPNDPDGWQRLIRSYAVLGDAGQARAALDRARAALKSNPEAQAALANEAKSLRLK